MFSSIQSIPGLIFARSDVKAKIWPGVEASSGIRRSAAATELVMMVVTLCANAKDKNT